MSTEPLQQEGYDFMAAAFEVYNELGSGFTEDIYHEALVMELTSQSIPFHSQVELGVCYKGRPLSREFRPDLVISGDIVVELKAMAAITSDHESQLVELPQGHRQACRLSRKLWLPGEARVETLCPHPKD